ncbi:MAG TPA: penicillin-binding protein 2 [Rhizomicrobium sp.]
MNEGAGIVQRRIAIAAIGSVLAFALICARLADLTLLRGTATNAVVPIMHAPLARADMVDRNGELLAGNKAVKDVYLQPDAVRDVRTAARQIAGATGVKEDRVFRILKVKHKPGHYVLVARHVDDRAEASLRSLRIPGIEFAPASQRFYPQGRAAEQVLGAVDSTGRPVTGLELGLDKRLREGGTVQLALDMRIQYELRHELESALQQFEARAAGGIVLNVNTGEILGMASLPDGVSGGGETDSLNPTRNRMLRDVYELGSVFKIFSFTLAMQDHTVRLDQTFPIGGGFRLGKYLIKDAERMPAFLEARDILSQSSNAGTAQIALLSGPVRQEGFLRSMGLLEPVHTEDPEGAHPLFPKRWGDIQTATIGFGHGISVSPLSFVAAAASVVNGGRRIAPTFLKRDSNARGAQVISPETSATMRELLRYVVTNGTGKLADVAGYDVGGKTGSAEKTVNGRYVAHKLRTSFCAVFPIDDPRYLVFVLLDEPHGANASGVMALAGHTAAPLAGRVVARIAPMLGLPMVAQTGPSP